MANKEQLSLIITKQTNDGTTRYWFVHKVHSLNLQRDASFVHYVWSTLFILCIGDVDINIYSLKTVVHAGALCITIIAVPRYDAVRCSNTSNQKLCYQSGSLSLGYVIIEITMQSENRQLSQHNCVARLKIYII